jgi:PadR family transcriptional regulator PadR
MPGAIYSGICRVRVVKMTRTTFAVVEAFLEAGENGRLYGLQIMKTAGIASGTMYPILDRLEDAGWIEGQWDAPEEPGRPARRYYTLTGVGITEVTKAVSARRQALGKKRRGLGPVTA